MDEALDLHIVDPDPAFRQFGDQPAQGEIRLGPLDQPVAMHTRQDVGLVTSTLARCDAPRLTVSGADVVLRVSAFRVLPPVSEMAALLFRVAPSMASRGTGRNIALTLSANHSVGVGQGDWHYIESKK